MEYIYKIKEAELEVCENAASFLQSSMWGEFKSRFGWKFSAFLIEWTDESRPLLVLSRRLLPGFSFVYIPWGPALPENFTGDKANALAELAKKLKHFLPGNIIFTRFEPPWYSICEFSRESADFFYDAGLKRAAATVQPPDTVIINLNASNEEILSQMKPKWRYNISLAEKKGIHIKTGGQEELEIFYDLLKETAQRDGIAIHSINYYKTLFELCNQHKKSNMDLRLYIASHEEDVLAAIFVLFRGKDATYLYGASSNNKRNLMAPYALQWKAMLNAKEMGCLFYELFGIPPDEDPNHPMAGLYRFKTGFGGQIIHRPGTWDYPYKKIIYNLFNIAEALRKKIRDRKKNRRK